MSTDEIQRLVDAMDPEAALAALSLAVKKLFSLLGEEARLHFVVNLVGEAGADKVAGLVHL